ncbi:MAG: (2Fe-2S)-binding protein, partial [Pseudomonadota bacterium]
RLWPESDDDPAAWPAEAVVCNCTGVTKGAIANAITLGAATLDEVRAETSANSVCGSCKPLVLDLLGQGAATPEPVRWWRGLLWASGVAAALALVTLLAPRFPLRDAFVIDDLRFNLWFDGVWKQWSGYVLLGLTVAAAAIGLRRRLRFLGRLGGYDLWRAVHLGIGLASLVALFVHTGFRLGSGLNFWLMASFCAALIFGAVAGLATGGEHKLLAKGVGSAAAPPRAAPHWLHIVALWPLPALLAIHILTVYSY